MGGLPKRSKRRIRRQPIYFGGIDPIDDGQKVIVLTRRDGRYGYLVRKDHAADFTKAIDWMNQFYAYDKV